MNNNNPETRHGCCAAACVKESAGGNERSTHTNHVGSSSPWHLIPPLRWRGKGRLSLTRGNRKRKKGFEGLLRMLDLSSALSFFHHHHLSLDSFRGVIISSWSNGLALDGPATADQVLHSVSSDGSLVRVPSTGQCG